MSVLASPTRAKVSIGSNPWNPDAAEDNLASLAEQYGGGGHPRVAAISLEPNDIERAKQVAKEIAESCALMKNHERAECVCFIATDAPVQNLVSCVVRTPGKTIESW